MTLVAVVVNVGTELATTLAVTSLRAADAQLPILVVNLAAAPTSRAHLRRLAGELRLEVVELPWAHHGQVLDTVIPERDEQAVLLFDSDAELGEPSTLERLREAMAQAGVFGAGAIRTGAYVSERWGAAEGTCYVPTSFSSTCAALRTDAIHEARRHGVRLETRVVYNDFPPSQLVSKALAARFQNVLVPRAPVLAKLPPTVRERLRSSRLAGLRWARRSFEGERPNYVYYDTGGDFFRWCTAQGLRFVPVWPGRDPAEHDVGHLGSTTIELITRGPGAPELEPVEAALVDRLRDGYGVDWHSYGVPAWSWPEGLPELTSLRLAEGQRQEVNERQVLDGAGERDVEEP